MVNVQDGCFNKVCKHFAATANDSVVESWILSSQAPLSQLRQRSLFVVRRQTGALEWIANYRTVCKATCSFLFEGLCITALLCSGAGIVGSFLWAVVCPRTWIQFVLKNVSPAKP